MRRFIETILILGLCLIPLGSAPAVAAALPLIMAAIILTNLILFSPIPYLDLGLAILYVVLWRLWPPLALFSPMLAYALLQRSRILSLVPLLAALMPVQLIPLLLVLLALWMSWQEQAAREREKAYYLMRDDFVQNEILQHRIQKEEELNHEKNLEIAVLQERNRISREIHDSVGHTISAALLQIEAMKLSCEEPVRSRLDTLSQALAKGMEEVRRSLHNLHNESISLRSELDRLIEPMRAKYQIQQSVQLDDTAPLPVKRAILTLLREALTNIRRHSDATAIRITLRELPRHYSITVKDNGSKQPVKLGIGLVSLEELSRSMDGVFSHGWSDGFYVHLVLPKSGTPPTDSAERNP